MPDLLIILIVILVAVIFWRGPKNLPKLGEALGRGVREARREAGEITRDKDADRPPDNRAD
jgi:Sec-independent protein translocase protein TatA